MEHYNPIFSKVPTLRFPEFAGEWQDTTLGNVCVYRKTRRTAEKKNYISTENILQNYQGVERFTSNESISGDGFNKNDILMGNIRPYLKKVYYADFDGVCNADVLVFKSNFINPHFLYCRLANDTFINYVMKSVKGSKMPRGDKSHIMQYPLSIPGEAEQSKISNFIELLTSRIQVQNKIISKYETLIKGLCDIIFPSIEGSILPLKAIVSIEKGQQINGMSLAKTGKYYYLNGGIAPSGYIDDYNTSEETISISEGGNSCGFVSYNLQKFWSGGHCYTLKIMAEQCRSKYLFFYLKYKEKDIMQLRVGSGLPNIQKKSLENFNVKLPNYKKQCFVERVFEVVTAKKGIENALLERFQSQKKFLLSKMFI